MRVMVIGKAITETEAGVLPTEAEFAAMGSYTEELPNAGMLAFNGLKPSSTGDDRGRDPSDLRRRGLRRRGDAGAARTG